MQQYWKTIKIHHINSFHEVAFNKNSLTNPRIFKKFKKNCNQTCTDIGNIPFCKISHKAPFFLYLSEKMLKTYPINKPFDLESYNNNRHYRI